MSAPMSDRARLTLAAVAIVLGTLVAGLSRAEPIIVNFVNTDEAQTIAQLRLCSADECQTLDAPCAPLAKCSATFDWEKGYWEFAIQGLTEDGTASPMSASGWRFVMSEEERYDRTGDGRISTLDYPFFINAFIADQ